MEIKANTKIFDLLKEYPALEEKIIGIAPPFKNLKNPVLRRTVGKLATIEKAAQIGEVDVTEFVNTLRREVGQPELKQAVAETAAVIKLSGGEPEWIQGQPQQIINGTAMLSKGVHPLAKVNELMQSLTIGQYILLQTNFKPLPLIEAMEKQSYRVFHQTDAINPDQHVTFIGKK